MERIERLSLTDNGLDDDPVLSYTLEQLRHHKVAQVVITNPTPEGIERWI
jgi:hypothetical protein